MEASGYRKFGLLATLIRNEQIKSDTVLFWDEPENSLNPELMPVLVDILLELQRGGVQIFIATHSEILASYFAVNREKEKGDIVDFYSLYKNKKTLHIKVEQNDRFDLMDHNNLTAESVKLYKKEIERGLGNA
jgi:predicted ATPase